MDEDTEDRLKRKDEQILVDNRVVSTSSLDIQIEGTNMTLKDYYEGIRPPDLA